jgi:hypothetical protein
MGKKIAVALALAGVLLIAGCAAGNGSEYQKNNGLYGGVSGGWSRP